MILRIRWMVYSVALLLTLLPTLAAFYAVRNIVDSAVQLAFNQSISSELAKSGDRLKELAKANPQSESKYRQEFTELQEIRLAYDTLLQSGTNLQSAYMQVFLLISGAALLVALLLAWWLNRRIIHSHDLAVGQMEKAKERAIVLERSDSWRLFAQKLVHEIKNPLTPVQVMVGRIPQKYESAHPVASPQFRELLRETKEIVNEEISKVNNWVESFSQYARMPAPTLRPVYVNELLRAFKQQYLDHWSNLKLSISSNSESDRKQIYCDPILIKQVLFNLAKNSSEAGSGRAINFFLEAVAEESGLTIKVSDDGPGLSANLAEHLFRPYASSKGDHGMGLGLAIGKKILLDHGGDLTLQASELGCTFLLVFPSYNGESL